MAQSRYMAWALHPRVLSCPPPPTRPVLLRFMNNCDPEFCSTRLPSSPKATPAIHDNGTCQGYVDAKDGIPNEGAWRSERGVQFMVGDSFYREESAVGRDLGVLAAAVYKKKKGHLSVLDALCGCGVRAARYMVQAEADFVAANDACDMLKPVIVHNLALASAARHSDKLNSIGGEGEFEMGAPQKMTIPDNEGEDCGWHVTIEDANKVLLDRYIQKNYCDLIDVDSFGSNSIFLGSALSAVQYGGLVYVTSTDGFSAGGHRPYNALASYGAYIRPMSFANELGLRMLMGGVYREGSLRNMHVEPVFSHYSFHGPVFRVMLRVLPSKILHKNHYNFVANCNICHETQVVQWNALGHIKCSCSPSSEVSSSITVSGPLWTGPLHNAADVKDMIEMAKSFGWIESDIESGERSPRRSVSADDRKLKELLATMLEESHPDLQVGYIELDEVREGKTKTHLISACPQISKRGKLSTPRRARLIKALHQGGYAASRSHVAPNAIKTNCSLSQCVEIARSLASQPEA